MKKSLFIITIVLGVQLAIAQSPANLEKMRQIAELMDRSDYSSALQLSDTYASMFSGRDAAEFQYFSAVALFKLNRLAEARARLASMTVRFEGVKRLAVLLRGKQSPTLTEDALVARKSILERHESGDGSYARALPIPSTQNAKYATIAAWINEEYPANEFGIGPFAEVAFDLNPNCHFIALEWSRILIWRGQYATARNIIRPMLSVYSGSFQRAADRLMRLARAPS